MVYVNTHKCPGDHDGTKTLTETKKIAEKIREKVRRAKDSFKKFSVRKMRQGW